MNTVNRYAAKRQVAAARALISMIRTRALRPENAATDHDQMDSALVRLETTTEALAREVYQPASNAR